MLFTEEEKHKSRSNGDSRREVRDKSRRGDSNDRHKDRSPADRRHRDTEHRRNGDNEVIQISFFSQIMVGDLISFR